MWLFELDAGALQACLIDRVSSCQPTNQLTSTPLLLPKQVADVARRILFASQLDGWQLGNSRVFLRAGQLAQLEVR